MIRCLINIILFVIACYASALLAEDEVIAVVTEDAYPFSMLLKAMLSGLPPIWFEQY